MKSAMNEVVPARECTKIAHHMMHRCGGGFGAP